MAIKYTDAPDLRKIAEEIVARLDWNHIPLEHVAFIRSHGSKARGTIARCHALGKAMQIGMGRKKGFYLVEVISERFDKMSPEEQVQTMIHELMHIPVAFGGGFKHHNIVNEKNVKKIYEHYIKLKQTENIKQNWF